MNNALRKYILTFCTLLFSAYCYTHAGSGHDRNGSAEIFESSGFCSEHCVTSTQPHISEQLTAGNRDIIKIFSEKNEEENGRPAFSRAYTDVSIHFTSFWARSVKVPAHDFTKLLSVCCHWFLSSSHRFAALRVFRL